MQNKKEFDNCIMCKKKLKDSISRIRGYGSVCWKKHIEKRYVQLPLFNFKLGELDV